MAVFTDPFDALTNFQQALDTYRTSSWLDAGLSGGGAFPPLNVFRKGDDFIIIAELPGVKKSDLDVAGEVGRTSQIGGRRNGWSYPEKAGAASPRATRRSLRQGRDNAHRDQPGRRQGRIPRRHPSFVPAAARRERQAEVDQGGMSIDCTTQSQEGTTMVEKQELECARKEGAGEAKGWRRPSSGRYYIPYADIYETDDALAVVLEMPGVEKKGPQRRAGERRAKGRG